MSKITLAKVKSVTIEFGKRILKVSQYGAKTAKESGPFGFDSSPLEGYTAVYLDTDNRDSSVIVGYIKAGMLCKPGESRMYALGSSGDALGYVYAREDGIVEICGAGSSGVLFEGLQGDFNRFGGDMAAELAKIAAAVAGVGGNYTPGQINYDLSSAKSTKVKLK